MRRPGGGGGKVVRAKAGEGEGRAILLTERGHIFFMFFVLSVLAVHLFDVVFLLLLLAAFELDEVEVLRSLFLLSGGGCECHGLLHFLCFLNINSVNFPLKQRTQFLLVQGLLVVAFDVVDPLLQVLQSVLQDLVVLPLVVLALEPRLPFLNQL